MISVYYDYQILLAQRYGGISRYFYEIYSRMSKFGAHVNISCIHNHNYYFAEKLGIHDFSRSNKFLQLSELGVFWYVNKIKAKLEARQEKYNIIHPTYYHSLYSPVSANQKLIITVHDMTHEKYVKKYPTLSKKLIASKREAVHAASWIIAVSENTKRDLLEFYPDIDAQKISVIYHGASMNPDDTPTEKFSRTSGHEYILFVGDRRNYKNFGRFVRAMQIVLDAHEDLHVFCSGGGAFTDKELALIGKEYISRFHQAGLSDKELSLAYSNALCFVFPSEYEGFGIPILEAFARNCPVICSNASSLPEVAGDAAEYFDPLNVEELADKLMNVINDEALCDKLRAKGRDRLKLFDWDKTTKQTLECYELALKN